MHVVDGWDGDRLTETRKNNAKKQVFIAKKETKGNCISGINSPKGKMLCKLFCASNVMVSCWRYFMFLFHLFFNLSFHVFYV